MQSVIEDNRLEEVRTRLLGEIKATKKRIHRDLHPLFNLTMQNKIDHANRILGLMDRYPKITVEELFYWIACRIEGEKFAYMIVYFIFRFIIKFGVTIGTLNMLAAQLTNFYSYSIERT
jgi:hypothetical protein